MRSASLRLAVAFTAILLSAVYLQAADDKEVIEGDLKTLQGKWTTPSGNGGKVTYTFKGRKLTVEAPSRTYEMTVTLDPAAKPEKTIDFAIDEAPADAKGKTSKGIYKFDGNDKLIWSFRPEGERPSKYEQVGFEQILSELKREKD